MSTIKDREKSSIVAYVTWTVDGQVVRLFSYTIVARMDPGVFCPEIGVQGVRCRKLALSLRQASIEIGYS